MPEITCLVEARAQLGEGAFWCAREKVLWWVDIAGRRIFRYDPQTGRNESFDAPAQVGCLATRAAGGLVTALESGFHFFDPATGRFEFIVDPEAHLPVNRFNDGKTDRQGRFWSGTTVTDTAREPRKVAGLYRLDADLRCTQVIAGLGCSNGLAWSPDSRTMYLADSYTPYVHAYDFDPATGTAERARRFVDLSGMQGIVDGATVDREGCYWLTAPFKSRVMRFDPEGKLMTTVELPTESPTCCEFGGPDLNVLYVTTATFAGTPYDCSHQPLAGALFAIDAGVRGLPSVAFKG
jgi:L-arabinonolactonase